MALGAVVRYFSYNRTKPNTIGPYKIEERIGEGGLGVVFKAEHLLLERPAAIKLLKSFTTDKASTERFEREVRLASKLVHPNSLAIYDFGTSQNGAFYYAMEYIDGVNLAEFVTYMKWVPVDRTIRILQQICGALREAHSAGIVHRDIKPANVMICRRGGISDLVKVLDYGLVKSFTSPRGGTIVETNVVMGTPRFMAPERLEMPWLADPRIDIFSVGAVAHFLLAGRTPILGANASAIMAGLIQTNESFALLKNNPAFIEFVQLIASCFSPEPSHRPGAVAVVMESLDLIATMFPWSEYENEVWWAEHGKEMLSRVKKRRSTNASFRPSDSQNPISTTYPSVTQ